MTQGFTRLAIVDRGEGAMRVIHAVREWNHAEAGRIATIALFVESERRSMFVREADEAVCLGEAPAGDAVAGRRGGGYVDLARLERALAEARADAAWVGWGPVAEDPAFAQLCERLGLVFVGPSADVMRHLGDKVRAKRLAESLGLAVVPWSGAAVASLDEARACAGRLGYPVLVKPCAGGGGVGIREARSPEELAGAFESARAAALAAFGDAAVFLERRLAGARHLEVQGIADGHGGIWALAVRDCTVQRAHRKVMEESPSPVLPGEVEWDVRAAAARLLEAAAYRNAGTVEFLWAPGAASAVFLEVNPALQIEHAVSEATTGVDLVKLALHVARGGRLEGEPPLARGHAIELRIRAEDPDDGFAPAPGFVDLLRLPTGPGLRVDVAAAEGDELVPGGDPVIAKLIAWGRDREEALSRLRRGLVESAVVVRGGSTDKPFGLALLDRPEVREASADTAWLDDVIARREHVVREHADVALLAAAVEAHDEQAAIERARFLTSAARGRPLVRAEIGTTIELRHRGNAHRLGVRCTGPGAYRVDAEGRRIDVEVDRLGDFERRLTAARRRYRVLVVHRGLDSLVEVEGVPHHVARDAGGVVRAPVPAVVLSLLVEAGQRVAAGDRVAVLEAMKMEMPVLAPFAGRVRRVLVTSNVQVDPGAPLLILEPIEEPAGPPAAERIDFAGWPDAAGPGTAGASRPAVVRGELRLLVLGYDVDRATARGLGPEWDRASSGLAADDPELLRDEDGILDAFADIHSLFRRERAADEMDEPGRRSAQEYLLGYMRSLDAQGEGLPPSFVRRLRAALAHHEIHGLERTPALEEALLRIYRSHERADEQVAAVIAILERRLAHRAALGPRLGEEFRSRLDRLIATARGRFPAIDDLAREVRRLTFDEPFFERARREVYAQAEAALSRLLASRNPAERAAHMDALVDCPQPLVSLLAGRFEAADAHARLAMLELLARRYYRLRALRNVAARTSDGQEWLTAEYPLEGHRVHLITTFATFDRLAEVLARLGPLVALVPEDEEVLVDLFVWNPDGAMDDEATDEGIRETLAAAVPFPHPLRRVVLAIAGPGRGHGMGGMQHFTYRPAEDDGGAAAGGFVEDRLVRGLHPMMAKRLDLWRLANFAIERLPSVEDVYLFRAVARVNPKDERLFALAEVRDLTPVRDEAGRIAQLPHLERMLAEAAAGIRLTQARRPSSQRLQWNRILLYVWPVLELDDQELGELAHRLAPLTDGIGLEQVVVRARRRRPGAGSTDEVVLRISSADGHGIRVDVEPPPDHALRPLGEYEQKVISLRRRGMVYPYEIVRMLTPARDGAPGDFPPGEFVEHDLDEAGALVPVSRPHGENVAHVVVGSIRNFTAKVPVGRERIILLGDPSKEMGSVAEPECRRIIAALALARERHVPVEWIALSAGAKISMESGTENMDWISRVLRHLIEFTQTGGEINVVVAGINVGAQPYWNAEATMLMHTRGILVMTPESAMVLTGKQALDYSGSVSAEDNQGIGGYERIMGPNGQAQYLARDLGDACQILLRHYDHTYVVPGERFPRRAVTSDPVDRDVRLSPHGDVDGDGFVTVGDVFSAEKNPGRKKPFDIRKVMAAVVDRDHRPLERWRDMLDAEIGVIWDAHLGGYPVCLIGMESRPLRRLGFIPADGPPQWTAGTLFPRSSKKLARSINAASGNRPVVVLANLSGFDGSPDSMRNLQLEYGAEIGRAVVNFRGPILFCVVSRYHGGAFVVFSKALNESFEAAALEGAYASVIGGAPAAAVVFARDVEARTRHDERVRALEQQLAAATSGEARARLRGQLAEVTAVVRSEKLGQVADEFDHVHSVERALRVGSLDHILPPARLRSYLVEALERRLAEARPA